MQRDAAKIEEIRRRNTDEKAVARLNDFDNLFKNFPACHKIIWCGSFFLMVIHWSLDKIIVGAITPKSRVVNLASIEKKFGNIC